MNVALPKSYTWLFVLIQAVCVTLLGYHLNRADFKELVLLYTALFSSFYFFLKYFDGSQKYLYYTGLFLRIVLLFSIPNLSQDFYRFIWDGRMLVNGNNPYLYLPDNIIGNTNFHISDAKQLYEGMGSLSSGHFTNYPPVNQFCFAIAALFAGKSIVGSIIVFKLIIIIADIGTCYFGRKLLKLQNLPEKNIFLYFLNPLVIIELTGNLHFEGVMIFFLIWSLYLLETGKLKWAAAVFALSVSVKLVPLMLLPLLYRKLKIRNAFQFYGIAGSSTVLLFVPFISVPFLYNYANTISLWFVNFEFNASIYYLLRSIGYYLTGYNLIHTIGKILPLIVLLFALILSARKTNTNFRNYTQNMLLVLCLYFFLSTTVHPWYIITPIALSVFTKFRFPLAWTFLVILSYWAYSNTDFSESPLLLIFEYAGVFCMLFWELTGRATFLQNIPGKCQETAISTSNQTTRKKMATMQKIGLGVISTVIIAAAYLFCASSCGIKISGKGPVVSHEKWTALLKKHVKADGLVDYKGFINDKAELQAYLDIISKDAPAKNWSENDKIAYWLNAYNAFTVKLIVDNYPVKSIKDLGPANQIIFVNTPWDKKFFKIGGRTMTLNNIEHRILRNQFTEPRIHFALNCASMSCPKLRAEAYEGVVLDKQLTEQATGFLSDTSRNVVDASNPKLSSIFNWYGGDMKKWSKLSLIQYINKYSPIQINENANIDYLKYDWNLNEAK